jgi:MFS family permease
MSPCRPGSRRTLFLLCLASCGWAFSFGLGAPLASLWLRDAGQGPRVIGLNTSLYYLGVVLASFAVPYLMRRAGRWCVVAGIVTDAVVTALFPWTDALPFWFLLRLLGGMGTALSVIPMETLVNHNAPPERRSRDFGYYAFSVALGVALGSLVGLPLYPLVPRFAFALAGFVTLASAVVAWFALPEDLTIQPEGQPETKPRSSTIESNFLSYGTAWVQGFLEGGLITFLSLYLLGHAYTEGQVSFLVGGLFAGVILCQVPLAWMADRLGRLPVLLGCHLLLTIALLVVGWYPGTATLAAALFVVGTCCGALYPLGLALLGDRVVSEGLARANACYLASNCAGSLSGPVVFGLVIDGFGPSAQFVAGTLAVILVLGISTVLRRTPSGRAESAQQVERMPRRLAG